MKQVEQVDPLDYVRHQLDGLRVPDMMHVAADAELSLRTVENVVAGDRDPRYSTVKKLYDVLRAKPMKPATAGA